MWGGGAHKPNIMFCVLYSLSRSVPRGKSKTGTVLQFEKTPQSSLAYLE